MITVPQVTRRATDDPNVYELVTQFDIADDWTAGLVEASQEDNSLDRVQVEPKLVRIQFIPDIPPGQNEIVLLIIENQLLKHHGFEPISSS